MKNIRNIVLTILAVMLFSISSVYSQVSGPELGPTRYKVKKNGTEVYDGALQQGSMSYNEVPITYKFYSGDLIEITLYGGDIWHWGAVKWFYNMTDEYNSPGLSTGYTLSTSLPTQVVGSFKYVLQKYNISCPYEGDCDYPPTNSWTFTLKNGTPFDPPVPFDPSGPPVISAYPNPSDEYLIVSLSPTTTGTKILKLYSTQTGGVVITQNIIGDIAELNTQNLPNGRYVLSVSDIKGRQSEPVLIIIRH